MLNVMNDYVCVYVRSLLIHYNSAKTSLQTNKKIQGIGIIQWVVCELTIRRLWVQAFAQTIPRLIILIQR